MIKFNERFSISLPAGQISESGQMLLRNYCLSKFGHTLPEDWQWVARVGGSGEYVGPFGKRVLKYYFQTHGIKVPRRDPDNLMGEIASLVGQYTAKETEYEIDFTRKFDWRAGDFGDDGSCFWSCHAGAKNIISDADGFAIRSYDVKTGEGVGRAWIIPQDEKHFLFNASGIETPQFAQIFAQHLGESYRKISLSNNGESSGSLWINSGMGFVIGQEESVNGHPHHDFYLEGAETCVNCGESCDDMVTHDNGDLYCQDCACDCLFYCQGCEAYHCADDAIAVGTDDDDQQHVCESCCDANYTYCPTCNEYREDDDVTSVGGKDVCTHCLENGDYTICEDCGDWKHIDDVTYISDEPTCNDCRDCGGYSECDDCGEWKLESECTTVDDKPYCDVCLTRMKHIVCEDCGDHEVQSEDNDSDYCNHCNRAREDAQPVCV